MEKMKLIPYGMTDFSRMMRENYYYVDKTRFIPEIEREAPFVFFLRPRRFGKSLIADILHQYYDVKTEDQFQEIFANTQVVRDGLVSSEHNKYLILHLNFSEIDSSADQVQSSFNKNILAGLEDFVIKYQSFLPADTLEKIKTENDSSEALSLLNLIVRRTPYRIYLIIDEYDNFANTILSKSEDGYKRLTHGNGFFRHFFNVVKSMTTGGDSSVCRIFITGVTPLTLSDVTSGFNIGMNLSMKPWFNELAGLTESEVRQMLEYYRDKSGVFRHSVDELIEIMKPWYNNSCFSEEALDAERIFNTDMVLYFMANYIRQGTLPMNMIDANVTSDMNKVRKMIEFDNRTGVKGKIIEQILNAGLTYKPILSEFKLEELGNETSLVSLLYYLGLLSYGRDSRQRPCLVITNQVVREQYFTYLAKYYQDYLGWTTDLDRLTELGVTAHYDGDAIPLLQYICSQMRAQSSNRDFNAEGENFVKAYILATLGNNNAYFVCRTENELNHGYCDISMTPKHNGRDAYLIELKYLKHAAEDKEVEREFSDAIQQLKSYSQSAPLMSEVKDRQWTLHRIVLVVKGWELARIEEITD